MNYDSDLFTEYFNFSTQERGLVQVPFEEIQQIVSTFKSKFRPGQTLEQVKEEKRKNV